MFVRFTDKSRRSVEAAFEEARMPVRLGVSPEMLEDRLFELRERAGG